MYNCSIYCTQIYFTYKHLIFSELFVLVRNKRITNVTQFDDTFYRIFDRYYVRYQTIKSMKMHNNQIIYGYIIKKLSNINLINNNFDTIQKDITKNLERNNNLQFPKDCAVKDRRELFHDIISSILRSIYTKNFYKTKEELLNHRPLTINDKKFIEQVKNNEYLFKAATPSNFKKSIMRLAPFCNCEKKKGIKADRTYISGVIHKYYTDSHIGSDIMSQVIAKSYQAYSSFFALRKKGRKANFPKFLPKMDTLLHHSARVVLRRSFFRAIKKLLTKNTLRMLTITIDIIV